MCGPFGAGVWQHGTTVETCSLEGLISCPHLCAHSCGSLMPKLAPDGPFSGPWWPKVHMFKSMDLPFGDWLQNVGWTILRVHIGVFESQPEHLNRMVDVVAWVFRRSCSYLLQLVAGANDCDTYDVFWSGAQRCPIWADRNYVCCLLFGTL